MNKKENAGSGNRKLIISQKSEEALFIGRRRKCLRHSLISAICQVLFVGFLNL
jgi:hypothetical protein